MNCDEISPRIETSVPTAGPVTENGAHPLSDSTSAPSSFNASRSGSIGRLQSEASPVNDVFPGRPAAIPASIRMDEPEFLQSMTFSAACRFPPEIVTSSPFTVTSAPSIFTALRVAFVSSPNRGDLICEMPDESAANM